MKVAQDCPVLIGGNPFRTRRIYFLTAPLLARMSSFNNSPWIRLVRYVRLLIAISSIKAMVSVEIGGLPRLPCDFLCQNNLNPCLCQPIRVSGFTTTKASRQASIRCERKTKICRSRCVSFGRFTSRSRTINCWRRNMLSAINSLLLQLKSAIVLVT